MKVGVQIEENSEIIFDSYDEAMDYIELIIPEVESLNINTDDIKVKYYG
tara:strand:+ start:1101 stop:1247 length:147 start_codon:yes stop_codon:yes gene_type:complete